MIGLFKHVALFYNQLKDNIGKTDVGSLLEIVLYRAVF